MKALRLLLALTLCWLLCAPESRADEFGNRAWGKSEYQSVITPDDEAQTLVRYQENSTGYGETASGREVWTKFDPLGEQEDGGAAPGVAPAVEDGTETPAEEAQNEKIAEAFKAQESEGKAKDPNRPQDTPEQSMEKEDIVQRNGGMPILTAPGQPPGGSAPTEGSAQEDKDNSEAKADEKSDTTKNPPPNPNGSKGAPDHQAAVSKLLDFLKKLFPDDRVESNKGIPGSNRRPDGSVIAPDGSLKAVGEVARTNKDGTLVPREQAKQDEYNKAGTPSTVLTLPKTPPPPSSPSPTSPPAG